ncbi:MAG TPA: glycoside hydrolase family 3 N-terminal domain-containing protein [Anaerolineales bacterium]|nr:glycoside hydrolase family 3 N-terminal domain-containing protein [Anaerolineales bacterium]
MNIGSGRWGRVAHWFLLLAVLGSILVPLPVVRAQTDSPAAKAQALLASMTPEERVGQLFLVTFQGTDTHDQTQVYDLISNRHVGGVVLLAANDNFLPEPDTIASTHQLITDLQAVEAETSPSGPNAPAGENVYVPLFVGVSQEGGGTPYDQILSGLTPVPNLMAIGATWRPELAEQVGAVVGSELSRLGINLFLGPSLDVVESPNPSARIDLGPRVFGGDPFWVGEMGSAYIAGLHNGSDERMVVVAKHFPGRGASDRSPEEEVAIVRKSLDQLQQVDLRPFFRVTNTSEPAELVDGLLVSHIRYQGFQGNIRATTRPVSLDEAALSTLVRLPEFVTWRANGGFIVSDALGSQAVRSFYSQSGENFSPRLVARDAFLAGNDLLYLGNITADDIAEDNTYAATLRVLDFFTQEYRADRTFAQRVDAAALRILVQKFEMYEDFVLSDVLVPESGLAGIGSSQDLSFEVARSAATLINPDPQELNTLLPAPPNQNDRITFLTDTSMYKQCVTCLWQEEFAVDALQSEVLRLYGPSGSGQVFTSRLNSFPFSELELMLNDETETDIEGVLERANWIVISLSDVSNGQITLLRRFFSERPNLLRNKNVILFSFTAPYYLDPTDVSWLRAYYGLYSKQPAFIDVAARLLFQQINLQGASPVSIPAVAYDLRVATSPDPNQIIPLALDEPVEVTPTSPPAPAPETAPAETPTAIVTPTQTEIPLYRIGDSIDVRAGPIFDQNQHIVPDGTPVTFIMTTVDESGEIPQEIISTTVDGIARASFPINRAGRVEIRAISEPAILSGAIQIQLDPSNEGAAATIVVPQPSPTITPSPTVTPTPLPEEDELITLDGRPRVGMWLIVMIAVVGGGILTFWAMSRLVSPRWGLRWALCVFLGGLAAYNYLALDFPGAADWIASSGGAFGVLVLTFAGQLIGSMGAWLWMQVFSAPGSQAD